MKLKDMDIVYVVKDSAYNEELKYSLRSVEENFPHNRVWIIGGKPIGVHPDKQVPIVQKGRTKWDRVRNLWGMICENKEITDKFVIFNDDFFILEPVKELPAYSDGDLEALAKRVIKNNNGRPTFYTNRIMKCAEILKNAGLSTHSFEMHVPMVIDKKLMLATREKFPGAPASRSLYGNYNHIKPCRLSDGKIITLRGVPHEGQVFLSTEDMSFSDGSVGRYIRYRFPNKSRFEK